MPITAVPILEALGATITGVTGGELTDPAVGAEVSDALDRHSVLVFPELFIDDDDLVALSHHLGEVVVPPLGGGIEGHPEILPICKDPAINKFAEFHKGNDHWHVDGTSYERPDKATLLSAKQAPDEGEGDTEFASMYAAYEALPDDEKAQLEGLRVRHTLAASQRLVYPDPTPEQVATWAKRAPREHPLVWRRADGRASLLLGSTAEAIVDMPEDESRALIDRLMAWSTQERFTLRHRWREGDLVIFDNTALVHRSLPYVATSPRLMHRTTLVGELAVA